MYHSVGDVDDGRGDAYVEVEDIWEIGVPSSPFAMNLKPL